ncbi:MAG: UDP-2,3-diacylglucosamine diphosphatase [Rhodocyclales bacterium]|nr:UDP-2,3-diacylglucosamine diphosphatase [Rhodocyclales bacterium]
MMHVRSIFISDVHLGTRGCQAERLLDFLRDYDSENLFLIGDIIDFWSMNRGIHWTPAQNTVVQKILRRARHGQRVMLIPGNHDEAMREYDGVSFGDIEVRLEYIHVAADGRRYLLLHGDEFDQVTRYHRWLAVIGDVGYNLLVRLNASLSRLRRLLRRPGYWSLAGYAKSRVKRAVSFVFDFEDSLIHAVRERELDGVICGHIHSAAIRPVDGVVYVNCGDWVDSCTAIVEHHDGRLELVRAWEPVVPAAAAPAPAAHATVSPAPARCVPAGTLDELPQETISCNGNAMRL